MSVTNPLQASILIKYHNDGGVCDVVVDDVEFKKCYVRMWSISYAPSIRDMSRGEVPGNETIVELDLLTYSGLEIRIKGRNVRFNRET